MDFHVCRIFDVRLEDTTLFIISPHLTGRNVTAREKFHKTHISSDRKRSSWEEIYDKFEEGSEFNGDQHQFDMCAILEIHLLWLLLWLEKNSFFFSRQGSTNQSTI